MKKITEGKKILPLRLGRNQLFFSTGRPEPIITYIRIVVLFTSASIRSVKTSIKGLVTLIQHAAA